MHKRIVYFAILASSIVILAILWDKWRHNRRSEVSPFCTRLAKVKIKDRRPALAPNYKLQWPNNTELLVYFMQHQEPLNDSIIAIANTWGQYCGVTFKKTDKITKSQIRLTFKSGGYASAVGIESKESIYRDQPTMFLQGLDTLKNGAEFIRVILHEFGHAIGLEHELQKSSSQIPWDTLAVYKYYSDHYHWDSADVLRNIFTPLETSKPYDEFDSTSIMIYAIPDTLTKGDYFIPWPDQLSETDKLFINKWYPKLKNKLL